MRKQILAIIVLLITVYKSDAGIFDSLRHLSEADKLVGAKKIFGDKINKLDSSKAMSLLNQSVDEASANNNFEILALSQRFTAEYIDNNIKKDTSIALQYYFEGLAMARQHDLKLFEIDFAHKLGNYYYRHENYPLAFEYLLSANAIAQSVGYEKVPNIGKYLYDIGEHYYTFQEFNKSISYLKQAQKFPNNVGRDQIQIPNTLALNYRSLGDIDSAYYYFQQALLESIKYKDTAWIGITNGNLGNIHLLRKEYDKALPMIRYDYQISMKYREQASAALCLMGLSQVALAQSNISLAEHYLDSAKLLMRENNNLLTWQSLYKNYAALFARKNEMSNAYKFLDSFVIFKDSLAKRNDIKMISQVEAKIETEKHLAALKLVESERKRQVIFRNSAVVILVLALIIVFQVLYRQKLRQKKNREIFEIEKKRAEEEIRNAEQLLESYVESVKEKSQLIENFKEEINRLQSLPNSPMQQEQQEIFEKLHHATILTDDDWTEFKSLFIKVHKDFFAKLVEKHPEITQAETRFLALTKLGLSVNEMASALGISPDSVRKIRLRLRKKINLAEHEVLEEILSK